MSATETHGPSETAERPTNETTKKANSWLSGARKNLLTGLVMAGKTAITEAFDFLGMYTAPLGVASMAATGNPIPLIVGFVPSVVGLALTHETLKGASNFEKFGVYGAKFLALSSSFFAQSLTRLTGAIAAGAQLFASRPRKK